MTKIPSFLFNSPPTVADLEACQQAGIIPRSVTVFEGPDAFEHKTGYLVTDGPPQWWANVSTRPGIGCFRLTGRIKKASQRTLVENRAYSSWARAFYDERPNLDIPELELSRTASWGKLSFARSINLPAEYPLGEIFEWTDNSAVHSFPSDCCLFAIDGVPYFERLTQAIERFKLTPQMPTGPGAATPAGGGFTADQVIAAVAAALDFGVRSKAIAILNGTEDNAVKAERLVKL